MCDQPQLFTYIALSGLILAVGDSTTPCGLALITGHRRRCVKAAPSARRKLMRGVCAVNQPEAGRREENIVQAAHTAARILIFAFS